MSFLLCCCVKRSASPDEAEKTAKESAARNDEEIEIPRMDDKGDFEIDCDDAEGSEIVNGNNNERKAVRDKRFKKKSKNAKDKYKPDSNQYYCARCEVCHDQSMISLPLYECYPSMEREIYQKQVSGLAETILAELNKIYARRIPLELDEHLQQFADILWHRQANQQSAISNEHRLAKFRPHLQYERVPCRKEGAEHGAIVYRAATFITATCIMKDQLESELEFIVKQMVNAWDGGILGQRRKYIDSGPASDEYTFCRQYIRDMVCDETAKRCGLSVGVVHAELGHWLYSIGKKSGYVIDVVLVLEKHRWNPYRYYYESDSD